MPDADDNMKRAMNVLVRRANGRAKVVSLNETMREMRLHVAQSTLPDKDLARIIVHYATSAGSAIDLDRTSADLREQGLSSAA